MIEKQLQKVENIDRTQLMRKKASEENKNVRLPLVLTYSRFLPNISNIIPNRRSILQINSDFENTFQ